MVLVELEEKDIDIICGSLMLNMSSLNKIVEDNNNKLEGWKNGEIIAQRKKVEDLLEYFLLNFK